MRRVDGLLRDGLGGRGWAWTGVDDPSSEARSAARYSTPHRHHSRAHRALPSEHRTRPPRSSSSASSPTSTSLAPLHDTVINVQYYWVRRSRWVASRLPRRIEAGLSPHLEETGSDASHLVGPSRLAVLIVRSIISLRGFSATSCPTPVKNQLQRAAST